MKTTMNRIQLLEILEENKKSHRDIFLKAQEGFRKKCIEILEQRLKDARDGKKIQMYIGLKEPIDQTDDYEKAIMMVKMHSKDVIELDDFDFTRFVLDEWVWSDQFITTNSIYMEDN